MSERTLLQQIMDDSGKTHQQVADYLSIKRSLWSMYVNKKRAFPKKTNPKKILAALGVTNLTNEQLRQLSDETGLDFVNFEEQDFAFADGGVAYKTSPPKKQGADINQDLSTLIGSNRILVESHAKAIEGQNKLIAMLEQKFTAGDELNSASALRKQFALLLPVLAKIALGGARYKSEEEALADLARQLYAPENAAVNKA